ncbi:MAG: ribonuclease T2 family protein [Rhodomicrobium sp.]
MRKKPMTSPKAGIFRAVLFAAALAVCGAGGAFELDAQPDRGGMPGDFDYYVLALSWSPTYCSGHGGESGGDGGGYGDRSGDDRGYDDRGYGGKGYGNRGGADEQCSGVRPYAFVLHGLWPQYERRGWPENCQSGTRPWVPEEMIDRMLDIMPSRRLVINEYKRHGVCSGLDPRQYFDAARRAYRSITIPNGFQDLSEALTVPPEEVRKAFLDANRQLSPDMIQVACSRNLLREVRVCFSKDLTPRACSQNEQNRRLCPSNTVTMPPVRGGGTGPHGGPSFWRGDRL